MQNCEIFDWVCKLSKTVAENEFNKGYAAGVCAVFVGVLLILIVKIILKIIFRRHRCNEVCTRAGDGDVSISVNAIEDTVRTELNAFPSVRISKLRLYRVRKRYMLNMVCEYDGKDGGLPQITKKVKETLNKMFEEFFGVTSIRQINLKFDRLAQDKTARPAEIEEITPAPVAEDAKIEDVKPVSADQDDKNDDIF